MKRILAALLSAGLSVSLPAFAYPYARMFIGKLGSVNTGAATLVFNYPNFQTNTGIHLAAHADSTFQAVSPYALIMVGAVGHSAGAAYYDTQQNIASGWTSDFTFQLPANQWGFNFIIQNTNATTNPTGYGLDASFDANGEGYGVYRSGGQTPCANSISIDFDNSGVNGKAWIGTAPTNTNELYLNGAPDMAGGYMPTEDLSSYSINMASGDTISVHLVYDGSTLTEVMKDTTTGNQVRRIWPLNLGNVIGSSSAWIGFGAGTVTNPTEQYLLSWDFYEGYNTRLATPTISPAAGQYSSSQSVTISCPSGATCYYTTNGKLPTTSDTQYTGAITVSASEVVSAVAVESGYTDSNVAQSNYQIQASGPTINFPSGFTGSSGLIALNGSAVLSGSTIQLTDTTNGLESGSAWYVVPVPVNGFSTSFTLSFSNSTTDGQGMTFCIQNQLPAAQDVNNVSGGPFQVSGGFNILGAPNAGLGYGGIYESVAVKFDLYGSSGNANLIGLYENGANPGGSNAGDSTVTPVSFHNGDPINVTLTYNNSTTTLSITLTDANVPADTYSTSWTVNIPSVVGGNAAYVGFTGGNGGDTAVQQITNWTM